MLMFCSSNYIIIQITFFSMGQNYLYQEFMPSSFISESYEGLDKHRVIFEKKN